MLKLIISFATIIALFSAIGMFIAAITYATSLIGCIVSNALSIKKHSGFEMRKLFLFAIIFMIASITILLALGALGESIVALKVAAHIGVIFWYSSLER